MPSSKLNNTISLWERGWSTLGNNKNATLVNVQKGEHPHKADISLAGKIDNTAQC